MKENIESEVKIIPEIMSSFGLKAPEDIARTKYGANHNYAIKTAKGDYFVRFLLTQTAEDIENEVAVQNQLKEAGITTPIYIKGKNGQQVFGKDGVKAVISKRIEGVIPEKTNAKLARDFGQKLVVFHKSVTELPRSNDKALMNPKTSGITSTIFDQQLPSGIIHGELWAGNVLVDSADQDKIVAVLDFEDVDKNIYIIDLAVTLMAVCTYPEDKYSIDPALIRAVVDGYESVRKLNEDEKSWLPEAMKYAAKAWIKFFKDKGSDNYAEEHQHRLDSFLSQKIRFD